MEGNDLWIDLQIHPRRESRRCGQRRWSPKRRSQAEKRSTVVERMIRWQFDAQLILTMFRCPSTTRELFRQIIKNIKQIPPLDVVIEEISFIKRRIRPRDGSIDETNKDQPTKKSSYRPSPLLHWRTQGGGGPLGNCPVFENLLPSDFWDDTNGPVLRNMFN